VNLLELKSLVHNATRNDVLLGVVPTLINQAIRYTEDLRSWSGMRVTNVFPAPSSATQIVLPSNFKEPQGGNTPILVSSVDCAESEPWMLISKQEMGKLKRIGTGTSDRKAFIDFENGGAPILVFPGPVLVDTTVAFDYYQYLPDLVLSTDHNWFTDRLPMLILWKAIALTFGLEQDQASQQNVLTYDAKFDKEFTRAGNVDAIQERRGRSLRMGGV